ncbi:MAG: GNAT family N-acetyltransferase [Thomasclavelia sp.]
MKKLLISDYDKIKKYLDDADYEGYNSNFVTMMMWDHEYEIYYEINENYLIMLHTYLNEHFFSMPFCKVEYYKEAVEYMLEYAKKHNFPFRIDLAVDKFTNEIKKMYQDKFLYLHNEDFDDYIYEKKSLETLAGKKMQKRRNHFNAFIKENPDYIYKEIEDQDIDNVLSCLKRWDSDHRNEQSVISEFIGIVYLLVHRHELNIKTGCIYLDGQLEAFIIGSPLKHKTVQIHVEKANKNIRGLYVAIGKFFLEKNYEDYQFVNREEDMGLESLRRAKKMLHPVKMLSKYTIVLNNQSIVKATKNDTAKIIELWKASFQDEDEQSTKFYFDYCYQSDNTYLLKNNDKIVSMLQIVPYTISIDNQDNLAYFILGVATDKNYRGQGLMKKLMNHVLSLPKYENQKILLQAYQPEIYYGFGFKEDYFHKKVKVDLSKYSHDNHLKIIDDYDFTKSLILYQNFTSNFNGYRKRDLDYYKKYLLPRCKAYNETLKIFYDNTKAVGYAIYSENDKQIKVSEIIYQNDDVLNKMITALADINKDLIVETDMNANIQGETEIVCTMMTNFLKNNCQDNKFYINECL